MRGVKSKLYDITLFSAFVISLNNKPCFQLLLPLNAMSGDMSLLYIKYTNFLFQIRIHHLINDNYVKSIGGILKNRISALNVKVHII